MIYIKRPRINHNVVLIKLGHLLLESKIEFDCEYNPDWQIKKTKRRKDGYRGSRFDLIIVKESTILAIIEIKPENSKAKSQLNRYSAFGVPVLLCSGESQIDKTFNEIRKLWETK